MPERNTLPREVTCEEAKYVTKSVSTCNSMINALYLEEIADHINNCPNCKSDEKIHLSISMPKASAPVKPLEQFVQFKSKLKISLPKVAQHESQ
jgi:hypothetical protein